MNALTKLGKHNYSLRKYSGKESDENGDYVGKLIRKFKSLNMV